MPGEAISESTDVSLLTVPIGLGLCLSIPLLLICFQWIESVKDNERDS